MTFEEFLAYIREHIGSYCTDAYWQWKYNILPDKSLEYVKTQMSSLAINAIGTDYASKNG
jgi:hypothetical protein